MLDSYNSLKENEKKSWNPNVDQLFFTLNVDNDFDKSIKPYIELLKTADYKKAKKDLNFSGKYFESNDFLKESFGKFIDYLLEGERYKKLFSESMQRYKIVGDNKEVYNEVYNRSLQKLELQLNELKQEPGEKQSENKISFFKVSQVIKLLRGDAFIFDLGEGIIRFEKDYLYDDSARKINNDGSNKPVYAFRMHVGENASIYSLNKTFNEMREFVKNVEVGAKPYIQMRSWLLDTDFLKYRLKNKGWTSDKIDSFINDRYGNLGNITLKSVSDSRDYSRISKRVEHHLSSKDKGLLKSYEEDGHRLKEGECLMNLIDNDN